jgi:hypothetical protein
MKRRRVPVLADLFEVSDPNEIKALARDPHLDRRFETAHMPYQLAASETIPQGAFLPWTPFPDDDPAGRCTTGIEPIEPMEHIERERSLDKEWPRRIGTSGGLG